MQKLKIKILGNQQIISAEFFLSKEKLVFEKHRISYKLWKIIFDLDKDW